MKSYNECKVVSKARFYSLLVFMMNRLIVLVPFVFSICKRVFPLYANEIAVPKIGNDNQTLMLSKRLGLYILLIVKFRFNSNSPYTES